MIYLFDILLIIYIIGAFVTAAILHQTKGRSILKETAKSIELSYFTILLIYLTVLLIFGSTWMYGIYRAIKR